MRDRLKSNRLRVVGGVVVLSGLATALAACGSSQIGTSRLAASSSQTTVPLIPTTVNGTPKTPVTGPAPETIPTQITPYPTPYSPDYSTVAELVGDSAAIVLGTLGPTSTAVGQSGQPITYYQINIQQTLNEQPTPPISLFVSENLVNAAHLSQNGTYVFFWAGPSDYGLRCIVGGVKGVMQYDASTDTITRLDSSASSQIPRTQTLEQLKASIKAADDLIATQPISSPPPACSLSATGLNQ